MSLPTNDYHGLWRSSANEGVPYSDDFPEALLVLPEFIDGALGAGKASIIDITINITDPKKCTLTVNDNGKGIISEKRIKDWASKDIGNNETENVYGHGSKKGLTKLAPDYTTAIWKLSWRKQDRKGLSGALNILSSPFKGLDTKHEEDDENEIICPNHGTRWDIEFDLSVFGQKKTADEIMISLQEICRVRYEPAYYQPYKINISLIDGAAILNKSSADWKSLKICLENEIQTGNVIKTHDFTRTIDSTTVNCSLYEIVADGRKYNIPGLPTFGRKNMNSSRFHIARGGRYIEAMPYSKFMGKEAHNSDNGKIGFVTFTGDLPTPCTTKVKMQEECPIFKKMMAYIIKHLTMPYVQPLPVAKKNPAPALLLATKPVQAVIVSPPPAVSNHIIEKKQSAAAVLPATTVKQIPSVVEKKPPTILAPPKPAVLANPKPAIVSAGEISVIKESKLPTPIPIIYTPETTAIVDIPTIEEADIQLLKKLHMKYGVTLILNLINTF